MQEKITRLLLSHAEMAKRYKEIDRDYPYDYIITNGKQFLYFNGVAHSHDPHHPQYKALKDTFAYFLKDTKKKNCVVLLEGGEPPVGKSAAEAITKYGDPGFTRFIAANAKDDSESPEPDMKHEIDTLSKKFSHDDIFYYYIARSVAQWIQSKESYNELKQYIIYYLERQKELSGWQNFDFSFEHFIKLHDQKFKHHFDPEKCLQCTHRTSDPSKNLVADACSHFRDTFIVSRILELWDQGKNIFVVYGSGHAIVQEPALKEVLT